MVKFMGIKLFLFYNSKVAIKKNSLSLDAMYFLSA